MHPPVSVSVVWRPFSKEQHSCLLVHTTSSSGTGTPINITRLTDIPEFISGIHVISG